MTSENMEMTGQRQYLTFLLTGEEFAISILRVKEIIEYDTVTTVPKTPKWVRGVINLRGAVVPVVDIGVKFGFEAAAVTKTTCIVIVEAQQDGQGSIIGVTADAVRQVIDLAASEILPVPEFGTRVTVDYLVGMAQLGKKFALLLDVDKVLSAEELVHLSGISPEAPDASPENGLSACGDVAPADPVELSPA